MNRIRKHRGLKRYYRNLVFKNELNDSTCLDFDNPDAWFDNWHLHFDCKGYGNDSFKRRKPHLDKLFRHFDLLVDKTKQLKKEFQLYSIVLDFDSYSDALFLNTHNPSNSQFPFYIPNLQLISTLTNSQLNNYLNKLDGYEKLYGRADEAFCILFKKNVGLGFRQN
ncbi:MULTISPECIES: hypothetical protein [Sphingobacterium]|uniref:hypothetical protein n=1 Tax=Sphingobacterium TaxID=28453 RepID=UPI0013DB73A8|nr:MULTISPECIES: hypothetical protein [unclassified Sphingobacterium]